MNSIREMWKKSSRTILLGTHRTPKSDYAIYEHSLKHDLSYPKVNSSECREQRNTAIQQCFVAWKAWSWWFYGLLLNNVSYYATSGTHWVCHLGMQCGTRSIPTKLWIVPIASVSTLNVRCCSCRASTMLSVLGSTQLPIEYGLCVNSVPKLIVKTTQRGPKLLRPVLLKPSSATNAD